MVTVVDPTTSYGTNAGDPDRAALIGGVGSTRPEQVHSFVRSSSPGQIWRASECAWWSPTERERARSPCSWVRRTRRCETGPPRSPW